MAVFPSLNLFEVKFQGHHLVKPLLVPEKHSITALYVRALIEKQLLPHKFLYCFLGTTAELQLRLRTRIKELIHVWKERVPISL